MNQNIESIKVGQPTTANGFIVPQEFIVGATLVDLEKILGINYGQFNQGAVFKRLLRAPGVHELEYFGDTRSPEHHFEERRNKEVGRDELSTAAYAYIKANKNIIFIKVSPIKGYDNTRSNDENWPSGAGAMQFKIKSGLNIPATIIAVVKDYPFGRFNTNHH